MRLHFRKTIGRYKKGSTHEVRDSLARVYLRANIAKQDYEQKVIAEPVSKKNRETYKIDARGIDQGAMLDLVESEPEVTSRTDEFDDITDEQELRIIALERGIKVHWNAGVEKIKEALRKGND